MSKNALEISWCKHNKDIPSGSKPKGTDDSTNNLIKKFQPYFRCHPIFGSVRILSFLLEHFRQFISGNKARSNETALERVFQVALAARLFFL